MTTKSGRIFIVEDEALIAMEIQDRLAALGYEVVGTARRGEDAVERIPGAEPDLVLMDISLAGEMSGVDAALALRQICDIPVVFLTAYSDDALVQRAMESEPYGYLVKPFDEREVSATVTTAIRKARMQRELLRAQERLLDRSIAPIMRSHPDTGFLSLNPAAVGFHGYHSEGEALAAIGDIGAEIYVDPAERDWAVRTVVDQGQITGHECEVYRHRTRERRWVRQNIWAVRDDDGALLFFEGFWEDITDEKRASVLLRESEARFQAQFRHTPHPVYVFGFNDGQGVLIDYNDAASEHSEGMVERILGLSVDRIYADRPDLAAEVKDCFERRDTRRREIEFRMRRDGPLRELDVTFSYAPPNLVLVHTVDIGARKEAERVMRDVNAELERRVTQRTEELAESDRFSRGILDAIGANVAVLDESGRILSANAAWRKFGASVSAQGPAPETEGANYLEVCDRAAAGGSDEAEYARRAAEGIRRVIAGTCETFAMEYPCGTPDGQLWFLCRVTRFTSDGPLRIVVTHDDVTEVRRAREEAAEKDRLFASLAEAAPVGVFRTDSDGAYIVSNSLWRRFSGLEDADASGEGWLMSVHPEDRERIREAWYGAAAGGETFKEEYRYRRPDGQVTWVIGEAVPVAPGSGRPAGYIGTVTDISERKRIEKVMECLSVDLARLTGADYFSAAVARLTDLLDADAAVIARITGRDREKIRTVAMIRDGWTEEDFIYDAAGTPCANIIGGMAGEQDVILVEDDLTAQYPGFELACELGTRSYAAAPLVNERGEIFGNIFCMWRSPLPDSRFTMSTLKLFAVAVGAQMAQESSVRKYQDLFEFAPDALVMVENNGDIAYMNRHAETLFGWNRSELIGQPVELLVPPQHRDGHVSARQAFAREPGNRRMAARRPDLVGMRKDGTVFPVEINLAPIGTDDEALTAAAVRDVTERRQMSRKLAQSTKIEAIGNLSGGIAHDYNNYLAVIIGNLDLIAESDELGEESASLLEMALDAAERGADLSRSLLAFSRRQPLRPVLTDLNERIEAVTELIQRMLGKSIGVEISLQPGLPPVRVDSAQFDSCIVNLATNARDAMGGEGTLTIMTHRLHVDPATQTQRAEMKAGDYVAIEVTDTGEGIAEEIREKVFDPFFTTKPQGQGTGLGLSMVYGFVRQSGGQVELISDLESGTTVRLLLPAETKAARSAPAPAPKAAPVGGVEHILVVEDNANLRRAVTTSISSLGYRVTSAANADAALGILEEHAAGIDLVFSDVVMPGEVDGFALANLIATRYPDVRVLLTSGFPGHMEEIETGLQPASRILQKPYRKEQLARAIRETVEGGRIDG